MRDFKTVQEARIKLGLTCRICNEAIALIPDFDQPSRYYKQESDSSGKCFTIAYPEKMHPLKLCYYHLKQHLGYFDLPTERQLLRADYAKDKEKVKLANYKREEERRRTDGRVYQTNAGTGREND